MVLPPATAEARSPSLRKPAPAPRAPSEDSAGFAGGEEEEEAWEEEPPREEKQPRIRGEEDLPPVGRALPAAAAQLEAPRRHPLRRKRPARQEPAADAEEEPAAAEEPEASSALQVYARARRRKRGLQGAPDTAKELPEAPPALAQPVVAAALPRLTDEPRRATFTGKSLADGVVEVPLPLLLLGIAFLAALGAFLLHEISKHVAWRVGEKPAEATVKTPPVEAPGAVDSSFLFHVLNSVQNERDQQAPAAEVGNKVPHHRDDNSSDDCSTCPRPEKEPESEYDDDREEVLGKLREADWALQIAYTEAMHGKKEGKRDSRKHQGHGRSSKRQDVRAQAAEALLYSLKAGRGLP